MSSVSKIHKFCYFLEQSFCCCCAKEPTKQKARIIAIATFNVPHNSYEISKAKIERTDVVYISRTPSARQIE